MIRSDGRENFITSIEIATAYENGNPLIPEVCVCFENRVFRGNRTSKVNAENFDAFISGNYPSLAEAGINIRYKRHFIRKASTEHLKVHKNLDEAVFILKLYPGINPAVTNAVFGIKGLKGIIMETYGSGNAPTDAWFLKALEEAVDRGILIVNVTQCKEGSVEIGKYQTSLDMGRLGIISGKDITTEAALAKLMYLFGRYNDRQKVAEMFGVSMVGEISE
jgi:L-asparaginase